MNEQNETSDEQDIKRWTPKRRAALVAWPDHGGQHRYPGLGPLLQQRAPSSGAQLPLPGAAPRCSTTTKLSRYCRMGH